MIKIDKKVKLVKSKRKKVKYPFGEMKVGDSFFVSDKAMKGKKPVTVVSKAAFAWVSNNKSDWKFTCRTVDNGVRVWRIK